MRPRLTYANVISTVCLFLLLAGGTALATHPGGQNTISTADIQNGQVKTDDIGNGEVKVADIGQGAVATDEIVNGQVKTADIGDGEVKAAEIANGQVGNAELAAGSVRTGNVADNNLSGGDVAANSLKGADIDEATLDVGDTARAYARMDSFTCPPSATECPIEDSKGVSSITRIDLGIYCVLAPGLETSEVSPTVTTDWHGTDGPEGSALAMTDEGVTCGATGNSFGVRTERQPITSATTVGPAEPANDVGFTIVIP